MQKFNRVSLIVILLSLVTLLFACNGWGEKHPDGYWWNKQSEDVKFFYVYGFVAGTNDTLAYLALLRDEKYRELVSSGILKDCPEKYIEAIISFVVKAQLFEPFSMTEILDGMDEFYKDFRNRRIAIDDAITVVRMQLKEEPSIIIEKLMEYLREKSRKKT